MEKQSINSFSEHRLVASESSSARDFDFHVGSWKISNRLLKPRLSNSSDWIEFESTCQTRKILSGYGNINEYRFQKNALPFEEGIVLRFFNPQTRLWSINWADSNSARLDVPVIGFFEGRVGTFFSNDTFGDAPFIVRAVYDASAPDAFVWSQAFSADDGKTFETNWIMTGRRQG